MEVESKIIISVVLVRVQYTVLFWQNVLDPLHLAVVSFSNSSFIWKRKKDIGYYSPMVQFLKFPLECGQT